MSATALNFECICKERDIHDASCAFPAHTVLLNQGTIERLGWEEGDSIGGLTLEAAGIQSDCFQLLCDKDRPANLEETVEAVSEERELQPTTALVRHGGGPAIALCPCGLDDGCPRCEVDGYAPEGGA